MDPIKREKASFDALDKLVGLPEDELDPSWLLGAEEAGPLDWPLGVSNLDVGAIPDLGALSTITISEESIIATDQGFHESPQLEIQKAGPPGSPVTPADSEIRATTATTKKTRVKVKAPKGAKSAKAPGRRTSRKDEDLEQMKEIAYRLAQQKSELEKKLRLTQYKKHVRKRSRHSEDTTDVDSDNDDALMKEMLEKEELLRKRRETLQSIWEAWNIGGLEDMEEISGEVYHPEATLINPDLSRELKGRGEIMAYWSSLISAFPDGIMLDYDIQEEDAAGEKFKVSWTFSGTQVEPLYGIPARKKQISIPGRSYVTFKGEQIYQLVIVWNYREMLMELLGMKSIEFKL